MAAAVRACDTTVVPVCGVVTAATEIKSQKCFNGAHRGLFSHSHRVGAAYLGR